MGLVQWCHILTVFLQLCYCLLWIWIRSSCLFLIAQILQTHALSCECAPGNPGLIYPGNYQLHVILTSTFNKVTFHLGNFTQEFEHFWCYVDTCLILTVSAGVVYCPGVLCQWRVSLLWHYIKFLCDVFWNSSREEGAPSRFSSSCFPSIHLWSSSSSSWCSSCPTPPYGPSPGPAP